MGPNATIYILCDLCDYKGTIRSPNANNLTTRLPCPDCQARRFVKTSITVGGLNTVLAEREQFRVLAEGLKLEVDRLTAEAAMASAALPAFAIPSGPHDILGGVAGESTTGDFVGGIPKSDADSMSLTGPELTPAEDAELAEAASAMTVAEAAGLVA